MVIYRDKYGFGRSGSPVATLDACSNYQACTSDRDVYAFWAWRDACGNIVSGPFTWRCTDGYTSLVAPPRPGVYILDVEYHKSVLGQDTVVGVDRMAVPVDDEVVEVHVDECRACRLFFVDKRTGLVNVLKLGDVEDAVIALPNKVFDGIAVGEGVLVTKKGVYSAKAVKMRKEIVFDTEEDMARWVAFKAATVAPEARIWLCGLGIDDMPEVVARALLFLAVDDPLLLTGAVTDIGIDGTKIYYEVVAPVGQLHAILAILSDVAFGCVAGAAAGMWLAGVGAVAGCAIGAGVGFVVGYMFHREELVSDNVVRIYEAGVSKINTAYADAISALEKLRQNGRISNDAYNIIRAKIDTIKNAALEALKQLKDAVQYVPLEEKAKWALVGGVAGFILGALRK